MNWQHPQEQIQVNHRTMLTESQNDVVSLAFTDCPANWINGVEYGCYFIDKVEVPLLYRFEVQDYCSSIYVRSFLVEIRNKDIEMFLQNLDGFADDFWWIGAVYNEEVGIQELFSNSVLMTKKIFKCLSKVKQWIWGNSIEPLNYTNWGEDQPNNIGQDENCGTYYTFTDGYAWYNEPCNYLAARRPLCHFCPPDSKKCQGTSYISLSLH